MAAARVARRVSGIEQNYYYAGADEPGRHRQPANELN
jgi:hypothetical protein